ncbi:MAG: EexN family lipoprotein [Alphaproteobacteria bacterium]
MRRFLIALSLLAVPASALAQTIPWFEAHPAERSAVLKRCRDDHRLGRSALCANAETAETRVYRRRLAPIPHDPDPPSAMVREGARRACARPPSERGLLGIWCGRI